MQKSKRCMEMHNNPKIYTKRRDPNVTKIFTQYVATKVIEVLLPVMPKFHEMLSIACMQCHEMLSIACMPCHEMLSIACMQCHEMLSIACMQCHEMLSIACMQYTMQTHLDDKIA